MSEVVARRSSAKRLSSEFRKIHRETPVFKYLSKNATCLHAVRLTTLLGRETLVLQNQSFAYVLQNRCS